MPLKVRSQLQPQLIKFPLLKVRIRHNHNWSRNYCPSKDLAIITIEQRGGEGGGGGLLDQWLIEKISQCHWRWGVIYNHNWSRNDCPLGLGDITLQTPKLNIARGTTDPGIDSVDLSNLATKGPIWNGSVLDFTTTWDHLNWLQIWPLDGATFHLHSPKVS